MFYKGFVQRYRVTQYLETTYNKRKRYISMKLVSVYDERIRDMVPHFLSSVTWNRMGLTARNLSRLLSLPEDFEMHIIGNNSPDSTWKFIQDLSDPRIKSKTRFDVNRGVVYAENYNLAKRKEDQYFVTVDNDVYTYKSN